VTHVAAFDARVAAIAHGSSCLKDTVARRARISRVLSQEDSVKVSRLLASSALVTLASAILVHAVDAQKPGATGTVVNGRVVVQVFVSLSDDETAYSPVAGLGLGFFRSPRDTAFTVTDGSGSATILLPPGNYRLASLSPIRWKGATYMWSVPVVVQPYMSYIDLRRKEAIVSRPAVAATRERSRVQPAIDPPQVVSAPAQQVSTPAPVAATPAPVAATPAPIAPTSAPVAPTSVPATYAQESSRMVVQQPAMQRSRSTGFYFGLGLEGDGILANESGSTSESGGGLGLVLGYGFTRRFSLYSELSGATMQSADGSGSYSLAHADLGTRVHFRAGAGTVVPFLQVGLSGRAVAANLGDYNASGRGGGVSAGGGLNVHISPAAAFSGAVTWTTGNFDKWQAGNWTYSGYSIGATSARLHLGMVWFP
jgi:hypothetical protein